MATGVVALGYKRFYPQIAKRRREPLEDVPKPTDWTLYDLPLDYTHGSYFPLLATTVFPPGLGYARLYRGSPQVGSSTWDADLPPETDIRYFKANLHFAKCTIGSPNILVYFDRPIYGRSTDTTKFLVSGKTVTSTSFSSNVLTITLNAAIVVGDLGTMTVTLKTKAVVTHKALYTQDSVFNDADLTILVDSTSNATVPAVTTVAQEGSYVDASQLNKIVVYFDGIINNTVSAAGWTVEATPAVTVSSVTYNGNNKVTLNVSRSFAIGDLSTPWVVKNTSAITTKSGAQTGIPAGGAILAGETTASFKADRGTYVLVQNRFTEIDFPPGTIVIIDPTSYRDIEDNNGLVRRVYDTRVLERREEYYSCSNFGGNTIGSVGGTNFYGVKPAQSPITEVPTEIPDSQATYADGLGFCNVFGISDTSSFSGTEWCASVVTVDGNTYTSPLQFSLPASFSCRSVNRVLVPITGTNPVEYAHVYLMWGV
jgi:hypothetical protein